MDTKTVMDERSQLTTADFVAAKVDMPRWDEDPIPSLETWRRWRDAEDKALAHKHALARVGRQGP
jgi:hypothetical protein